MKLSPHLGTSDRLLRAATLYHREARKCIKGKAYLAAVVLKAAALEAALQSMCAVYTKDVRKTAVYRAKKFRRKRDRVLEFTFKQLIDIASELNWFPTKRTSWAGRRTTLAGFAHEVREVRNFIHPGRFAKDRKPMKFSKGTYEAVDEVCDVANSWLIHRVEQGLLKAMEREKK